VYHYSILLGPLDECRQRAAPSRRDDERLPAGTQKLTQGVKQIVVVLVQEQAGTTINPINQRRVCFVPKLGSTRGAKVVMMTRERAGLILIWLGGKRTNQRRRPGQNRIGNGQRSGIDDPTTASRRARTLGSPTERRCVSRCKQDLNLMHG
jgi:hypothetical protein